MTAAVQRMYTRAPTTREGTEHQQNEVDQLAVSPPTAKRVRRLATRRRYTDELKLHQLGYRQVLARDFRLLNAIGVCLSVCSPLAAMTRLYDSTVTAGGPAVLFWAWLLACLLSSCLAASVAEVASALPAAGAVHFWSYSLASTGSRAGACWVSGWLLLAGRVAAAAAAFHGFAYQLAAAVAVAKDSGPLAPWQQLCVMLGLLLLAGLACCASVRAAAAAASLAALWNTVALAAFCTTLLLLTPERRRPQAVFAEWHQDKPGTGQAAADAALQLAATPTAAAAVAPTGDTTLSSSPVYQALLVAALPMVALAGQDSPAHFAEETLFADTTVPYGTVAGAALSGVGGLVLTMVLGFARSADDAAAGPAATAAVLVAAAARAGGGLGGQRPEMLRLLLQIGVARFGLRGGRHAAVALFSMPLLAMACSCVQHLAVLSRLVFAMGRSGLVPLASPACCHVPNGRSVPLGGTAAALLLVGALTAPMCFAPAMAPSVTLYGAAAIYLAVGLPVLLKLMPVGRGPLLIPGPFALRRRLSRASALASLLWVAVAVGLAVLPRARPVTGSSFNYTGPVLAASVAAILLWFYTPGCGQRRRFWGPHKTLGRFDDILPARYVDASQRGAPHDAEDEAAEGGAAALAAAAAAAADAERTSAVAVSACEAWDASPTHAADDDAPSLPGRKRSSYHAGSRPASRKTLLVHERTGEDGGRGGQGQGQQQGQHHCQEPHPRTEQQQVARERAHGQLLFRPQRLEGIEEGSGERPRGEPGALRPAGSPLGPAGRRTRGALGVHAPGQPPTAGPAADRQAAEEWEVGAGAAGAGAPAGLGGLGEGVADAAEREQAPQPTAAACNECQPALVSPRNSITAYVDCVPADTCGNSATGGGNHGEDTSPKLLESDEEALLRAYQSCHGSSPPLSRPSAPQAATAATAARANTQWGIRARAQGRRLPSPLLSGPQSSSPSTLSPALPSSLQRLVAEDRGLEPGLCSASSLLLPSYPSVVGAAGGGLPRTVHSQLTQHQQHQQSYHTQQHPRPRPLGLEQLATQDDMIELVLRSAEGGMGAARQHTAGADEGLLPASRRAQRNQRGSSATGYAMSPLSAMAAPGSGAGSGTGVGAGLVLGTSVSQLLSGTASSRVLSPRYSPRPGPGVSLSRQTSRQTSRQASRRLQDGEEASDSGTPRWMRGYSGVGAAGHGQGQDGAGEEGLLSPEGSWRLPRLVAGAVGWVRQSASGFMSSLS